MIYANSRRTIPSAILLLVLSVFTSGCAMRWPWEITRWFKPRKVMMAPEERGAITQSSLLAEMADLDSLAEYPSPAYINRQASSYDRRAVSPDEAWFANGDAGQFVREEDHSGRKEYVLMDVQGPGVITSIWSANPGGNLRFYFNGEAEASFMADMKELLGGNHPLFPGPFAGMRSAGWNLYFPIAYTKGIKVTSDAGKFYYQVNYRTYPAGTEIEDFNAATVESLRSEMGGIAEALRGARKPVLALTGSPQSTINPGERKLIFADQGNGRAVDLMRVRVEAIDVAKALRGILLLAYFDDDAQPAIQCPLGDFFGTGPGANPYVTYPLGILADGTMYSRWVMPYQREAKFFIINQSGAPAKIAMAFHAKPIEEGWHTRSMHFHAGFRAERQIPTRPFRDWNYVSVQGKGVFVGDALAVTNPVTNWWGEGDEKIYIDGETFPSHFGTGTEDYYGYAWCSPVKFFHPYHSQPRCDGPGNYGHTSVNRFHILDAIPFERDFRFDMEVWHSTPNQKVDYAAVSYWYALPGSTSNLKTPSAEAMTVPEVREREISRVAGAIEAEKLVATVTGKGKVDSQHLSGFEGKWSGEAHAWFTEGQPGSIVEFRFDAPAEKAYEVFAQFTRAPDYGTAQISINGTAVGSTMDFYEKDVKPSKEISLGVHRLKDSGNILSLKVVGANEKAVKSYMLGVDYIKLRPVD